MKIRKLYAALLLAMASVSSAAAANDSWSSGGEFEVYHNGEYVEIGHNLVPAAARSYLLRSSIDGGAQTSSWYGMPFANAVDPTSALTAANFDDTLDEFTNYTETSRPQWQKDVEAAQAITNTTLMKITVGAGGGTINGIALSSVSQKGSTGGLVLAAFRFASPRAAQEGDVLEFRYTMRANA